jgi:hypothetical protein
MYAVRKDEEAELVRYSRELLAQDRLGELEGKARGSLESNRVSKDDRGLMGFVEGIGKRPDVDEHDRISIGSVESEDDGFGQERWEIM